MCAGIPIIQNLSSMRPWSSASVSCAYHLFGLLKHLKGYHSILLLHTFTGVARVFPCTKRQFTDFFEAQFSAAGEPPTRRCRHMAWDPGASASGIRPPDAPNRSRHAGAQAPGGESKTRKQDNVWRFTRAPAIAYKISVGFSPPQIIFFS